MLLEVSNLSAGANGKKIINRLNLNIRAGEIHVFMGPNGAGKSTLANIIAGRQGYDIMNGDIKLLKQNINLLPCDERARMGLFMSFQHPIEIPGVSWNSFLKTIVSSIKKEDSTTKFNTVDFIQNLRQKAQLLNIDINLLKRDVNHDFSGGEKKKFEILQMLLLNPKLAILDEIDSGLDIDALKIISKNINSFVSKQNALLIITHYTRILNHIIPDFVHIFSKGTIIKSGTKDLAIQIEEKGYDWCK